MMKDKDAAARLAQAEKDNEIAIEAGAEKVSRVLTELQSRQRATPWGRMSDAEKRAVDVKRRAVINDARDSEAANERKLQIEIERAIRVVPILDSDVANLQVQNLAAAVAKMASSKLPVGDPTPFRDAGTSATKTQLDLVTAASKTMAAALRGLHQPAILALADADFSNRLGLLRTMEALTESTTSAKKRIAEQMKHGKIVPPKRGRTADLLPSVIARLIALHFQTMVGAIPNANGRSSRFVTMLGAVLKAAKVKGNARHYAVQVFHGENSPSGRE